MKNFKSLLKIIEEHPGLDAWGLKKVGWRSNIHWSLKEAEELGLIEYRVEYEQKKWVVKGWFVKEGVK